MHTVAAPDAAEPERLVRRRAGMSRQRRHLVASSILIPALALSIAACGGSAASAPPSASPAPASGDPSAAPSQGTTGAIDHKTGATDILLRYDEGGGFIMPAFLAASAPHFTLYGDGTILFRDPALEVPPMGEGSSVFKMNPMRTAKLSEEQIQDLLAFALGEGGLAAARPEYLNQMISDASTATFTIAAGGIEKQVAVYALGLEMPEDPDRGPRAAFKALADRLVQIEQGGAITATDYAPPNYRVTLIESPGAIAPDVRQWPWEDVELADFQPSPDPNGPQFPHTTMTAEQVAALEVADFEGGFQGLIVNGPDGKEYTLAARPLLPGETE